MEERQMGSNTNYSINKPKTKAQKIAFFQNQVQPQYIAPKKNKDIDGMVNHDQDSSIYFGPDYNYGTDVIERHDIYPEGKDGSIDPYDQIPWMDGEGNAGISTKYARGDHQHPSDDTKVDKVQGKGLSTNDFTNSEKNKLSTISSGAEQNQNAFSYIKVGSSTVSADNKTSAFEIKAGLNVSLATNTASNQIIISATGGGGEGGSGVQSDWEESDEQSLAYILNKPDLNEYATTSQIIPISDKGVANGVATLNSSGKVSSEQLPGYVDDIEEYSSYSELPSQGESGKLYITSDDSKVYRWSGTTYVQISGSVALGITHDTAFYGDYGKEAYDHAQAKGSSYASGLYKIQTNSQGHVIGAVPVVSSDITSLGIPAEDTNTTYDVASSLTNGLMSTADKVKLDALDSNAEPNQNAFSIIKAGTTAINASNTTDTIQFIAGTNVELVADTVNKTVTINSASGGGQGSAVDPATASPLMDGVADVGISTKYAREDHVHPMQDNLFWQPIVNQR